MFEKIKEQWNAWYDVPFPREAYDLEVLDLISIDTFSAGCISVYVERHGELDQERITCLRQCSQDLDACLGELSGGTREYFEKLSDLSRMVLDSLGTTSPKT